MRNLKVCTYATYSRLCTKDNILVKMALRGLRTKNTGVAKEVQG